MQKAVYGIMVFLFEEIHFERQNGEEGIYVALNGFDAMFLPCPYLRGDIIVDGDCGVLPEEASYLEVEAGIVYQYHYVGLPAEDVLLAVFHAPEYLRKMQKYGHEAHVCEVAIVLHEFCSFGFHHVAAYASELRRGILLAYGCYEVGCMQVAAGFSGNDVVLHLLVFSVPVPRISFDNCASNSGLSSEYAVISSWTGVTEA